MQKKMSFGTIAFSTAMIGSFLTLIFAAPARADMTDAQIAGLVMTANEGEIKDAKLAQTKGVDKEVKDFATQMVTEHTKNIEDGKTLAKKLKMKPDMMTDEARELKKTAATNDAALSKAAGAAFDKMYIDQQVSMHQTVSTDLETKLIPAAKDHDFKNFLENTKSHVDSHLKQARAIQTRLTR